MDWLWILAVCIVLFLGVQITRLAIADCDLSLQWAEKFGVRPESLRGKVVWITGSSSGIGECLAYEMASAGCRLVLTARREAELQRVKQGCMEKHGSQESDILILPMDMVKFEEHQQAVETVLKYFKKIDILVNNAGRSQRAEWEKIHLDVDRQMLELNVVSVISLTRCVLPHMMDKKEGHIVVTSSVAGKLGVPGSASYTGSKHALHKHGSQESDILILPMDMVKFEEHQQAVETVLKYFKKIDILVNNAGRSQRAEWEKIHLDVDRQMLELNVVSVISLTRCVLPHMMDKKEGHIVVTSSVAGKLGVPGSASYTGSKHALHGYFEALRIEGADRGIVVTMLCPGPVFSNLLEIAFTDSPGKNFGGKMDVSKEKRMPTKRCAQLCAVAIANKVQEAWISCQPALIFLYLSQYFPNLGRWVGMKVGLKIIKKIREGKL